MRKKKILKKGKEGNKKKQKPHKKVTQSTALTSKYEQKKRKRIFNADDIFSQNDNITNC